MDDDKRKVLLIDDSPRDSGSLRKVLQEAMGNSFGLECHDLLSSGLKRLGEGGVDLILLSLPDNNGLDAFKQVKERAGQVPVVILGNADEDKVAIEAVRQGA